MFSSFNFQTLSKVSCTLVQALSLCTGLTTHRGSRGIDLPYHDHGTRSDEGSASRPGRSLPPGKTRYPLYRRLVGPQDRSGQVRKISLHTGIRSPDRPARSQSLYRLSYWAQFLNIDRLINFSSSGVPLYGFVAQHSIAFNKYVFYLNTINIRIKKHDYFWSDRRIIRHLTLDKAVLRPFLFILLSFQFAVAAHVSRSSIIDYEVLIILHAVILAQSLFIRGTRLCICLLTSCEHRTTSNGNDRRKVRYEIILHIINHETPHIGSALEFPFGSSGENTVSSGQYILMAHW
jgi:hypothetical protein